MKNIYTLLILCIASMSSFAQAPEKISYQAIIRDNAGQLINNQSVGMRISVLQGTANASATYSEVQSATTNANGLVSIEIGTGNVTVGTFSSIDWSNGPYFISVETDPTGAENYTIVGTSQLLSVPFALHAKTAETVINDAVEDADANPENEMNSSLVLNGTNLEITDAKGTLSADLSGLISQTTDADADPTNEMNTAVVLNGTDLEVTDGNGTITTDLSSLVNDADADATNEMNTAVVLNGTDLEVTDGNGTITTDLSSLVNDADADATNEMNTAVVLNGTNLEVTDGNGTITTDLSSLVNDADADATNEMNTAVVLNGTNLEVTDGNGTITTDLSSLVNDADADATNEMNTAVVLNGTNLEVTDGNGTITTDLSSLVNDADADATNEMNTAVLLNGTNLEVTDGNGTITTDLSSLVNDADADATNEIQNISSVLTEGNDAGANSLVNVNQLAIGTATPNPSAAIEVNSTNKAILLSRMTTAQRDAMTDLEAGMMIFNTDVKKFQGLAENTPASVNVFEQNTNAPLCLGGAGQSFTASSGFNLQVIEVRSCNGSQSGTLTIYAGDGLGGTVLATQSVSIVDGINQIILNTPIALTTGGQYTFATGFALSYTNSGNPYAGGRSYSGTSAFGNDIYFKVGELTAGVINWVDFH